MSNKPITVLGIETSCDETAVSIIRYNPKTNSKEILANNLYSQISEHRAYGGVVPEIAARSHIATINDVIHEACTTVTLDSVDAIAVTAGPGLNGGLIVGIMFAKGLSMAINKPCIPINHLEGHSLTPRLEQDVQFPYIILLASGGHCQFLQVNGVGDYKLLGETLDDAAGEAFDKVAKMLNLPYPGGPQIERLAKNGNPDRFKITKPFFRQEHCNMSFSGVKTFVKRIIENFDKDILNQDIEDICASFQETVSEILCDRLEQAIKQTATSTVAIAGGVSANMYIRSKLESVCTKNNVTLVMPSSHLCTDNGAMIAWAGIENIMSNGIDKYNDLDFGHKSRWPLESMT